MKNQLLPMADSVCWYATTPDKQPAAAHHYLGPRAEKLQSTRSQICIDQTPMVILPHQVLDFQLYIAQDDSR